MPMILRRLMLLSICVFYTFVLSATEPKREMRGVWVATVWGIDWPSRSGVTDFVREKQKGELEDLLDRCKKLNFTTVCFQVRSMGDAMYKSSLEPWSAFVSGKRGLDPGWDPLAFVVRECHSRGLECYAWVNPFRWSSGTDYNTEVDKLWKRKGWLLTYGKYTVFNPGLEEVRQHVVAVCREIVEGYDVDGIIFDDYFYPNRIPETAEAPDHTLYMGESPWMTFGDWRRANVHKVVADVKAMIADIRPGVRFGISPAGVAGKADTSAGKWGADAVAVKASDWQYDEIYSDPLGWMYQGTVDFISPQIYWSTAHVAAPYGPIAGWWGEVANMYGCHLYPSLTLERLERGKFNDNVRDVARQIAYNRLSSIDGNQGTMIYSAKFLPKIASVLSEGIFSSKTLTPVVGSAAACVPERPKALKRHGNELKWNETSLSGISRYSVYAIPRSIDDADAMDEDGDGVDGAFLLGVTYEPRFDVSGYTDHRFAVCSLDGFSIESAPVWID